LQAFQALQDPSEATLDDKAMKSESVADDERALQNTHEQHKNISSSIELEEKYTIEEIANMIEL
jgi:hypothetical protein